ncbi:hypothetical protein DRE45_21375 [Salmonella enterica subsp. enterica]|nr:hypothetical protein [Salmonella enterica]ECE0302355.1 hypothetical protein [Salmonella enterica subsp. enterica serovar Javiana]EAZ2570675.1 hypothetical protein [Salmonella enterica]EBA1652734.1 hypothetical protein [Salmonella enterica]EBC5529439.1 hypothetical protein [Salmonella enterica]
MKKELDLITQNKHVMVFSGFSALGYENIELLKKTIKLELKRAINVYGEDLLCVVAGATSEGIGIVYDLAKEMKISTLGIVSEQAKGHESPNCDKVVYVPDPEKTWKVLDVTGNSYMVYVATQKDNISRTGEFIALGGGNVTLSELNEAKRLNLFVKVYPNFKPDSQKISIKNNPKVDLTPVKNVYGQGTKNEEFFKLSTNRG